MGGASVMDSSCLSPLTFLRLRWPPELGRQPPLPGGRSPARTPLGLPGSPCRTYQNPQQIKVPVSGGSRVRLQVTMVRSSEEITYDGFVRVAWASAAFA
ncbi:hypothetical protein GCM10023193_34080 [Planotetraspora kaengkrachanensis]|uniref:Uncharacterized protein n=1 Tax=Planotetraspora kaengkrachanensis TaxID=575193 RepID=A0A8J3PSK5_9ACTN|nr:hypothetical protein Pka01_22400 [Planotetraspora kaengkrachanensis]